MKHTADKLGSNANTDLLVLYHDKPNGVKKVITEGKKSDLETVSDIEGLADMVMMVSFPCLTCVRAIILSSYVSDWTARLPPRSTT